VAVCRIDDGDVDDAPAHGGRADGAKVQKPARVAEVSGFGVCEKGTVPHFDHPAGDKYE